jgi:1,4-dihydroxy-2-naphthoate octaprenyltransferase
MGLISLKGMILVVRSSVVLLRKKVESITKDIKNERESLHYRLRRKES